MKQGLLHIVAVLLVSLLLLPILWAFRLSMTPTFSTSLPLIPHKLTGANYIVLIAHTPFLRWLINSILVAGIVAALNVIFAVPAGYVLARGRLPGHKLIFLAMISAWVTPTITILVSLYLIMAKIGLVNTYAGVILPLAVSPMSVFLARQYVFSIPKELEEAAFVDGCSRVGAFLWIIFPLTMPIVFIIALTSFVATWGNFIVPFILINSEAKQVIATGVPLLQQQAVTNWGIVSAAAVFGILPPAILYGFFGKLLAAGLGLSAGTEIK